MRRVGIALTLYQLPFEHRPWSVFGNAAEIQPYNPLIRVPTLVLDDGTALIESHSILDYLDHRMPAEQRLFPQTEPQRHRALRIASLATGLGEKAVSLFYEQRLHQQVSEVWVNRCQSQIKATLAILESDRSQQLGPCWFGDRIGHADIAVAAVLRFLGEAHPGLVDMAGHPALQSHAQALEALPAFQQICQAFIPPA